MFSRTHRSHLERRGGLHFQCQCQRVLLFQNNNTHFPINICLFPVFTSALFQILTQEDWNKVLYNGMASTSPVAALYFIALMTFGNYVLFNLLVAILVEGFQAEVQYC